MAIVLFVLWILLNGRISADMGMVEIIVSGVIAVGIVCLFAYKVFGITLRSELRMWKNLGWLIVYVFVLIWEVIKANLSVLPIVVNKKRVISPEIIKVKVPLKRTFTRVILANSITLTPGTITVDLEGDEYTIHCLDSSFAEGIESSSLVKLLERMEK